MSTFSSLYIQNKGETCHTSMHEEKAGNVKENVSYGRQSANEPYILCKISSFKLQKSSFQEGYLVNRSKIATES